jgi:hypothetical protein
MTALPANVKYEANPDGWTLDQYEDENESFRSVQSFLDGKQLIVETFGEVTIVSPAGKRRRGAEFQQNVWIELPELSWRAVPIVYGVVDDQNHTVEAGIQFERSGTAPDIIAARHI